ncbi:glycosyltransferase family A protein [Sandarakinorhabdus sp.]|uniref:glycosyltransferase family 2 protein n=1 Tax=Sandarakinorhabdus sp. TaxID=1916663 RepID=UPI00333F6DFB
MTSPHFSVIIPMFNAIGSLGPTVASVLEQSDPDFELIIVDDGSADNSVAIALAMAAIDDRIRVVSQANAGPAAARNLGVELARGGLLAFLDADDIWHQDKLACHRAFHNANADVGVSYARIAFLEAGRAPGTTARTESTVPPGPLTVTQLIGENPVCTTSNVVVTRACIDAVGGFRAGMGYAEDQEWLARVAAAGFGVCGIDRLLVEYRLSPTGLSSNLRRMYRGWRRLAHQHRASIDLAAAEAVYCRYLARRALRSGGPAADALNFALRGMRRNAPAFLADRRRGGLTLAGAFVGMLLPATMRARLFA